MAENVPSVEEFDALLGGGTSTPSVDTSSVPSADAFEKLLLPGGEAPATTYDIARPGGQALPGNAPAEPAPSYEPIRDINDPRFADMLLRKSKDAVVDTGLAIAAGAQRTYADVPKAVAKGAKDAYAELAEGTQKLVDAGYALADDDAPKVPFVRQLGDGTYAGTLPSGEKLIKGLNPDVLALANAQGTPANAISAEMMADLQAQVDAAKKADPAWTATGTYSPKFGSTLQEALWTLSAAIPNSMTKLGGAAMSFMLAPARAVLLDQWSENSAKMHEVLSGVRSYPEAQLGSINLSLEGIDTGADAAPYLNALYQTPEVLGATVAESAPLLSFADMALPEAGFYALRNGVNLGAYVGKGYSAAEKMISPLVKAYATDPAYKAAVTAAKSDVAQRVWPVINKTAGAVDRKSKEAFGAAWRALDDNILTQKAIMPAVRVGERAISVASDLGEKARKGIGHTTGNVMAQAVEGFRYGLTADKIDWLTPAQQKAFLSIRQSSSRAMANADMSIAMMEKRIFGTEYDMAGAVGNDLGLRRRLFGADEDYIMGVAADYGLTFREAEEVVSSASLGVPIKNPHMEATYEAAGDALAYLDRNAPKFVEALNNETKAAMLALDPKLVNPAEGIKAGVLLWEDAHLSEKSLREIAGARARAFEKVWRDNQADLEWVRRQMILRYGEAVTEDAFRVMEEYASISRRLLEPTKLANRGSLTDGLYFHNMYKDMTPDEAMWARYGSAVDPATKAHTRASALQRTGSLRESGKMSTNLRDVMRRDIATTLKEDYEKQGWEALHKELRLRKKNEYVDNDGVVWRQVDVHTTPTKVSKEELFTALGKQQREAPEVAMLRVQHFHHGRMSPIVEHTGDFLHRMTHRGELNYHGYPELSEKIPKIRWHISQMASEHADNIANNARTIGMSVEAYTEKLNGLMKEYTAQHRALPVYNELQARAREAAIAVGEQRWKDADNILAGLEKELEAGPKAWSAKAGKIDPSMRPKDVPLSKEQLEARLKQMGKKAVQIPGKPGYWVETNLRQLPLKGMAGKTVVRLTALDPKAVESGLTDGVRNLIKEHTTKKGKLAVTAQDIEAFMTKDVISPEDYVQIQAVMGDRQFVGPKNVVEYMSATNMERTKAVTSYVASLKRGRLPAKPGLAGGLQSFSRLVNDTFRPYWASLDLGGIGQQQNYAARLVSELGPVVAKQVFEQASDIKTLTPKDMSLWDRAFAHGSAYYTGGRTGEFRPGEDMLWGGEFFNRYVRYGDSLLYDQNFNHPGLAPRIARALDEHYTELWKQKQGEFASNPLTKKLHDSSYKFAEWMLGPEFRKALGDPKIAPVQIAEKVSRVLGDVNIANRTDAQRASAESFITFYGWWRGTFAPSLTSPLRHPLNTVAYPLMVADRMNYALSGQHMWDNEPGKRFMVKYDPKRFGVDAPPAYVPFPTTLARAYRVANLEYLNSSATEALQHGNARQALSMLLTTSGNMAFEAGKLSLRGGGPVANVAFTLGGAAGALKDKQLEDAAKELRAGGLRLASPLLSELHEGSDRMLRAVPDGEPLGAQLWSLGWDIAKVGMFTAAGTRSVGESGVSGMGSVRDVLARTASGTPGRTAMRDTTIADLRAGGKGSVQQLVVNPMVNDRVKEALKHKQSRKTTPLRTDAATEALQMRRAIKK